MFNISLAGKSSREPNASKKFDDQPQYLELDEIRRDGGTQPWAAINLHHVKLLEEQIEEGQQLEPVIVFYDGTQYWLADGFHRWHAHRNREEEGIACVIHQGSRRDAVLYSVGANADHKPALPRSREDKRRSVMTLLNDPEWKEWSTTDIASACKVSTSFVSNFRRSLFSENSEEQYRTYRTKHGTIAKMRVNNIGQSASKHIQELSIEEKAIAAQSKSECVYLMSDRNYYKIGYTTSILARTYEIKAHNPQIKLLHVIPCLGKDLERKLHYLFNSKRVHGEWFDLHESDVDWICAISDETSSSLFSENSDEQQLANDHLQLAHHLKLIEGGLVEIHAPNNCKINGRLARIAAVHKSTVEVWVRDVNTMTMDKHTLKHQQVEPMPINREPQLVEVCDRITELRKCNLDPFEIQILLLLEQPVAFTPVELKYLAQIENDHGIVKS